MADTYSLEAPVSNVDVSSANANLLFSSLAAGAISVGSNDAVLGYQVVVELTSSVIEVRSNNAQLSSPSIVGLTSSITVSSGPASLRLLVGGYPPSTPPTTRSFQPPSYRVEKTTAMNGRTVRQIMCSKPSEALLTLEYINVSDTLAEEVLIAYDQSYGTRYGFRLPPEVLTGAGSELLGYINMTGTTLRWFYAAAPSVESVVKGICNLSVQLRARLELSGSNPVAPGYPSQLSALPSLINVTSRTADLTAIPGPANLVIGQPYQGGYFAGYISETANGVATHALIVAPSATGATGTGYTVTTNKAWKPAGTTTTGASSIFNGRENTDAIIAAGLINHPAAEFCVNLTIGGYTDWYLPSDLELQIAYANLKPTSTQNVTNAGTLNDYSVPQRTSAFTTTNPAQTTVAAFQEGNSQAFSSANHWSSSQSLEAEVGGSAPQYAKNRTFNNGNQNNTLKSVTYAVRAFRKVAIPSSGAEPPFSNVSLLLHMNGSNNSTVFTDSSINGFTLSTFGDAKISTAQSKFGGSAGYFDGSGDYLTCPTSSTVFNFGSGNFTVEAWVYVANVSGVKTIAGIWPNDAGASWRFLVVGSSIQFLWRLTTNTSDGAGSSSCLTANTWAHVAAVRNGSTVTLYCNGISVGSKSIGTSLIRSASSALQIGRNEDSNTWFMNGYMDDLRITRNVAFYTSNFTPPSAPFPDS